MYAIKKKLFAAAKNEPLPSKSAGKRPISLLGGLKSAIFPGLTAVYSFI